MVDRLVCSQSPRLPGLLDVPAVPPDLLDHLAHCRVCQEALEQLAVGDSAWLRSPPSGESPAAASAHFRQVVAAMKQLTAASDLAAVPADLALDFLVPIDYPGALGAVGPYPVLEVVGCGGMGIVFRAIDRALNRVIAVKVLAPQWAANGTARARFTREARAAAAVAHEHVVSIHAVDEANGLPYLVMEYVPGPSLQERIDRDGPLDPKDVARVALQVAEGLAAAHAQGLVHRDVKPANILLENGVGRVRLSDFGLARAIDDAGATQHGTIAGTPDYMAPEQANGQVVDHRADLYSLGCVIYALCTGRPPFRAATALGVLHLTTTATPLPIRAANPDVPADLEAIALRLLEKDPADRFQTAEDVAAELRAVLVRMQRPELARPRSRRRVWAVAALVALLAGAVVVALAPRRDEQPVAKGDPEEKPTPPEAPRPALAAPVTPDGIVLPLPPETFPQTNAPAAAEVRAFDGHTGSVRGLAVHPDGRRLVSATGWPRGDGFIRTWDLTTGKELHRIAVGDVQCDALTLTPDGDTIVAGFSDGTVRLYEWDSETELVRLFERDSESQTARRGGSNDVVCVTAPSARRIAAAYSTGRVRVWDAATGRVVQSLWAHSHTSRAVAFSPDGRTIATGGLDVIRGPNGAQLRGTLRLWDATTGARRAEEPGDGVGVWGVAFVGGKLLTVGQEATVRDAETGRPLFDLPDSRPWMLTSIAVSPDGTRVAAGGIDGPQDGYVRVWDLNARRLVSRTSAGVGAVWAVAFTPDGVHVLAGGGGVVRANQYHPGERFTVRMWAAGR